ncbi:MAG: DNA-binding protein [Rhodospirillales bacterium]|nr:DNA-binding protein [Rhodospirillales bacterium]
MQPDLIPFREWCKINGFGLTTGYKILNRKEISAVKIGKLTFIQREEAARWANSLPSYQPVRS